MRKSYALHYISLWEQMLYLYISAPVQMESRQKLQTFPRAPALNISELPGNACNDLISYLLLSQGRTQVLLNRAQVPPPPTPPLLHLKLHQPFL